MPFLGAETSSQVRTTKDRRQIAIPARIGHAVEQRRRKKNCRRRWNVSALEPY
jgi:hypothetical protein